MTPDFEVAILGAGFGGLGMAIQLQKAGRGSFVILEKSDRVGGTWRDNTYPGAACDVPSHLYSYSFEPNPGWSRKFSPHHEIHAYIERLVDKYRLRPHIRFGAEVAEARWDGTVGLWRITTAAGETITARAFVAAWGQLNRLAWPAIPGREAFAGVQFHSARWDHAAELSGKRVAVIGAGASAVQFVPEIAPKVASLTLYQRTPNWIVPRGDRAYAAWERALFKTVPPVLGASRAFKFWLKEYFWAAFKPGTKQSEQFRQAALTHLEAQVPDPELRAKLTPAYELGCKRILTTDDFYPALTRPNVEVVTERPAEITATGVRTADGADRPADVIIYATGFETNSFLSAHVFGEGGASLAEAWADGPQAYLGVTVEGFPNWFMLYGPNTNLGHNSIIFMMERQMDYVVQALAALDARGDGAALAPRPEVVAGFNARLQEELKGTAFAGSCASWYKTADGRIVNNWSGSAHAYRRATAKFNPADYREVPVAALRTDAA